ncbi:MAG: hypothetical protein ACI8X5_003597 [Planctomycetota bacterium]|jgi:hypothetical protein
MNSPIRLLLTLLGLLLLGSWVPAASQRSGPSVTAQLSSGLVKFGSVATCVVRVEGARSASLDEIPEIPGMRLERRSTPTKNSVRNFSSRGGFSSSVTISWVLTFRPEKIGDYVIPPMRLNVDGRALMTRELNLRVVNDMTGQELGYFEFLDSPKRVYEGQPFTLRMNFGWDSKLASLVNVANLILPWWNELPGALEVEGGAELPSTRLIEVNVNSRARVRAVDLGESQVRGKPFRMLQLTRSYVATRSGSLEFPQSWLEFGHVRSRGFREERETYHVGVPSFTIEVKTLPEAGRPPEFSGGVGTFEVQASVNRRDLDLGESIKLTVDWTGDANLEFFELPNPARMDAFKAFRVYGTTNEHFYGDRRRVVYDLAPKSADVSEIPPLSLSVFDPELEEYRTVRTKPIPIRVRALEGVTELSDEGDNNHTLAARDIQPHPTEMDEPLEVGGYVLVGTWFGLPILWLACRMLVRRRGDPDAPVERRRRAARKQLSKGLRSAKGAGDQSRALSTFLAARSYEEPEAWEGRDARAWFTENEVEVDESSVDQLEQLASEFDQCIWAGDNSKLEEARVRTIADSLLSGGF